MANLSHFICLFSLKYNNLKRNVKASSLVRNKSVLQPVGHKPIISLLHFLKFYIFTLRLAVGVVLRGRWGGGGLLPHVFLHALLHIIKLAFDMPAGFVYGKQKSGDKPEKKIPEQYVQYVFHCWERR